MVKLHLLTEEAIAEFHRLRDRVDELFLQLTRGELPDNYTNAPDVYWIYVSSTVVPAGTGTSPNDWTPGSLALPIYKLNRTTGKMTKLTHPNGNDFTKTIYNNSPNASGTEEWRMVERDKFGDWYLIPGGGGGGGIALLTSAMTARSGTTVGSGTADLVRIVGTTLTAIPGETGKTIYNTTAQESVTNKYIQYKIHEGKMIWDVADC